MSKDDDDNVGKPVPPEALATLKHELFFGTPAPSNGGRFKKGQSGNPKGRPKRAPEPGPSLGEQSLNAVVARELRRLVTVREGDQVLQIPAIEALVRAQFVTASKGNAYAQRDFLDRSDRALREETREIAEHNAFWEEYCAVSRAQIEQAKRKGEPEPMPLPHPDDIVIEHGKRVRFVGPVDEASAAGFDERCRLRDTLLMQHVLDEKLLGPDTETGAMLCALLLDITLPPRMRLGETAIIYRMMRHESTPKRELLKTTYRAWRALGRAVPRGWVFPPQALIQKRLEFMGDLISGFTKGELDVAAMARGEFDEAALALMRQHGIAA